MNVDVYSISSDESKELFEFQSFGLKGVINKIVVYSPTSFKGVYNLGFGDFDRQTSKVDDRVISNNGDIEVVLSTVVETMHQFFDKHKNTSVYLTGSTSTRTRLYRIAISKYFTFFSAKYEILGELESTFECFDSTKDYNEYLISIKK